MGTTATPGPRRRAQQALTGPVPPASLAPDGTTPAGKGAFSRGGQGKPGPRTAYARGRAFEYRVRDLLRAQGYFVMRAPGSRSPMDLVAVKAGLVLFVQAKTTARLDPAPWNALFDLGRQFGALPVVAAREGRKVALYEMTDHKRPGGRAQPWALFRSED